MRRGEILAEAITTRKTPPEIREFYPSYLEVYRAEPQIIQTEPRIEQAAWGDISYALHSLPITSEQRSLWLMTLPPEMSAIYDETKAATTLGRIRQHPKTPFDRFMSDVHQFQNLARRARFKVGLALLGR